MIAIRELLIIVVMLAGLFCVVSQFLVNVTNVPSAPMVNSHRGVYRISLDFDERHMWVYRHREGIYRLELKTGEMIRSLPVQGMDLTAVAHSGDGSTTVVCGVDGTVIMDHDGEYPRVMRVGPPDDMIASVSDNGAVAACVMLRGRVHGWSRHESEVQEFSYDLAANSVILQIFVNPSGRRMLVARSDGMVSFHVPETGDPDGSGMYVGPDCVAFAWSRDERLCAVVTSNSEVRVYDVTTGRVVREGTIDGHIHYCPAGTLKISPDGRRLAISTCLSTAISVWDLKAGAASGQCCGHGAMVRTLQFSSDSNRLFSGSHDGTVREWSLETCSQLRIVD